MAVFQPSHREVCHNGKTFRKTSNESNYHAFSYRTSVVNSRSMCAVPILILSLHITHNNKIVQSAPGQGQCE